MALITEYQLVPAQTRAIFPVVVLDGERLVVRVFRVDITESDEDITVATTPELIERVTGIAPILGAADADDIALTPLHLASLYPGAPADAFGFFFGERYLDFAEVRADDMANWMVLMESSTGNLSVMNRMLETVDSKIRTPQFLSYINALGIIQIFAPFRDTPLSECGMSLAINPAYGFYSNLDFSVTATLADVVERHVNNRFYAFTKFEKGSLQPAYAAEDTIRIPVQLVDSEGAPVQREGVEVFFEATAGYLPQLRGTTNAVGRTELKLILRDVDRGVAVKAKVGFKNYSGLDEYVFGVI